MSARLALVLVLAGAAACAIDDQAQLELELPGTLPDYAAHVQPVLEAGCASLDCHGDAGRPLRLYATNGLRLDASLRGGPPTDDELAANMRLLTGLDPEVTDLESHLILLKPLAVAAGGVHHVGGDLWPDQRDPAYRCLHSWLRDGTSDAASQQICDGVVP